LAGGHPKTIKTPSMVGRGGPVEEQSSFSFVSHIYEIFSLIFTHPVVFGGITLVSIAPYFATVMYTSENEFAVFLIELTNLITFAAGMGAAAKAVIDIQNNGYASFGKCLRAGFSKSGNFLILFPFSLILITIMALLSSALVAIIRFFLASPVFAIAIVTVFAAFFLSFFILAVPAIVLENCTSLASLKRSQELTSRKIPQISLFLLILFAATLLLILVLFDPTSLYNSMSVAFHALLNKFNFKLAIIYLIFATVLFTGCGVFYKSCYKLTESKKVEDLANIF
jgi:hypothetical protein